MRFFVLAFAVSLFAVATSEARADQYDPSLEPLFTELRDGSGLDVDETTARIVEIWSVSQSPTATLLFNRASEAAVHGEHDLALELARHVTGLAPSFAQGWVLFAELNMIQGDYDGAYAAYDKALELEPRHFIATTDLADILYANGEERAAFDLYQQALKWNPHYERALSQARDLRNRLSGQEI